MMHWYYEARFWYLTEGDRFLPLVLMLFGGFVLFQWVLNDPRLRKKT